MPWLHPAASSRTSLGAGVGCRRAGTASRRRWPVVAKRDLRGSAAHGGIGKTTLAVYLAVGLAKFTEATVAFIDGDLWMGDSLVTLNVTATRTILDATVNGIPNDPEVWTRVLMDHSSGVKVLAPPQHLEDVERVPEWRGGRGRPGPAPLLQLRGGGPGRHAYGEHAGGLELADQVLVVLTPELGAVRNTLRLLTASAQIGLTDRIRIVLNRSDAGLEMRQVQAVIPRPVGATIPSDGRLFVSAANLGVTVYDVDPSGRTAARRSLEALAREVYEFGRPKMERPKGGMLSGTSPPAEPRRLARHGSRSGSPRGRYGATARRATLCGR